MVRRLLDTQPAKIEQSKRENLFHTCFQVFENVCLVIMDRGSCCNCYSSRLVDKLSLTIKPRPKPHKLQWINSDGGRVVEDLVSVPISIGKYEEGVIYGCTTYFASSGIEI